MSARGAVLALLGVAACAMPAPADDFLARWAATDRFRSGRPGAFDVAPDGTVLFLRSGPRTRVRDLWAFEPGPRRERLLLTAEQLLGGNEERLTPEELARRERLRQSSRGIASFVLSPDGHSVLVPLSGRLFLFDRRRGGVRELHGGDGAPQDPRFSPDGTQLACVRDGDLHVFDLASGVERRLTRHAGADTTWGLPEFVAQEEMDRFEGYWWSPDSRALAVQWTNTAEVERFTIADPAKPGDIPQTWPYPRPGRRNADVRLAVIPAAGGEPRWVEWDRAAFPYLCRATWSRNAPLTLLLMDRAQQHAVLATADPVTLVLRTVHEERDSAWLNLQAGSPTWLADGRSFLWLAERGADGPVLEWRDASGIARARLAGDARLRVRELLAVTGDGDDARAWFVASREPSATELWSVRVAAGATPEPVATEDGVHELVFARERGDRLPRVHAWQPLRGPAQWRVEDARGRLLGRIASRAEDPGFEPNVTFETVGPDSLRAAVIRPRTGPAGARWPVIDYVYAGPHAQRVVRHANRYLLEQWLADQGFVVVSLDGRGTPWRGRAFERAIRGDLAGPALADQVAGLRELLARHPDLDAGRVGLWGWSFGGYFTAHALMRAPDTFRAGVAGAPVVDWLDYDTFYTERYLGVPPADSAAYARSSVLTYAPALTRPLQIQHGTADDNVYFFNSLKLADALHRAGRSFELVTLPGQTHSVVDPDYVRQSWMRAVEFLRRELGSAEDAAPPRP